ncbi:MAG: TonB-dependent receptor [Thiotrichaceae bacterium]|nr:TonB-dependent receptor [Thiotrichaceae bacterium]PCI10061.1 MAG: TonB-dependent receptor [Thiotrichales bacterium]
MALNECDEWAARVVSVQGVVEARATDNHRWQVVKQGQTYCPNDMIHVRENSRAALELANETIIRLDQNTTIVLSGESEAASWLDLLKGAVHFITRTPNSLKIKTPYVNAAVEGTEFVIRVENGETTVSVIEGRVSLENKQGQLLLTDGQSASAREGEAPVRRLDIIPEDAVQWSLYYPSVIDKSLNNLDTAEKQPLIVAADHLLTVGRVREAEALLTRIHQQHPDNASAYAMQSIIALTQNRTEEAQALATTAFTLNPTSPAAAIALSYAQQAQFDLRTAHETLHMALRFTPDNSLLLARKAELLLSLGHLDEAEVMAQRAIGINPKQAHALTILGFSHLGQFEVERAKRYFERAISLNQADPLPRLGHGLAVIRNGKLTDGRREIEIAASLNPVNALIRSYLGKAYYEEKRNALAEDQFILAKSLDPLDPTPWFYDAIRKQTLNRPVEALQDLQQSIRLNDNRAVYRSRLLLDQDHAARSASLARIYNDLGFSQLALSEGWKSVSTDPTNHSAHRLLADSYSALPRHEIARVSELLQAQMLQPLNLNPIQPQLAESSLGILDGAGPANASANEFNPLFTRNRFSLQMNGVVASQDNDLDPAKKYNTRSVDMIHSGVWGRYSYSLGTFHDYNEGIRPNHDRDREIDNLFIQVAVDHNTSVQLEYRNTQSEEGDLPLRYDPALFSTNKRILIKNRIRRLGLRHDLAPGNTLLFSAIRQERTEVNSNSVIKQFPLPFSNTSFSENAHAIETGHTFELQHLLNYSDYRLISGIGTSRSDSEATINANFSPAFCPPSCIPSFKIDTDTPTRHHNGYLYAHINPSTQLTWTLGISIDDIEMEHKDDTQFNPKLGLTWQVNNSTMLRAAAFRSLKRRLTSNQTLEPTHISGFNQFYDDINGTESRRYGIALEKKYKTIQAGIELSRRDLTTLFSTLVAIAEPEWQERLHRAYLYWAPLNWLAASAEYQYESFKRPAENSVSQQDTTVGFPALRTHQLPLGITLFSASGFTTKITATYIDQKGLFSLDSHRLEKHAEDFWTMDASVSYRLNKRMGRITVGAKNLLGKNFRYHNVDFATNRIMPERMVFTHLSLSF